MLPRQTGNQHSRTSEHAISAGGLADDGPPTRDRLLLHPQRTALLQLVLLGARTRNTLDPLATAGAVADPLFTLATATATARNGAAMPLKHSMVPTAFADAFSCLREILLFVYLSKIT